MTRVHKVFKVPLSGSCTSKSPISHCSPSASPLSCIHAHLSKYIQLSAVPSLPWLKYSFLAYIWNALPTFHVFLCLISLLINTVQASCPSWRFLWAHTMNQWLLNEAVIAPSVHIHHENPNLSLLVFLSPQVDCKHFQGMFSITFVGTRSIKDMQNAFARGLNEDIWPTSNPQRHY